MEIFKIAAFVLCAAVFASVLDRYAPWAAISLSVAAGAAVLLYLLPKFKTVAECMTEMFGQLDGGSGYAAMLLKVTAISFIAQMTAQICADAGQKAMGDKIETAAKVLIAVYALPLISDMLKLISAFFGG